jgi:membrane-bound lytic murein transglycosylase D
MLRRCLLLLGVLCASPAFADDDTVRPGVQDKPPGPVVDHKVELKTLNEHRRNIRGTPITSTEGDPGRDAQRRFDEESFHEIEGRGVPVEDSRQPIPEPGRLAATGVLPTAHPTPRTARPEEIRPDLPWLKKLKTGDLPVRWDPRVIRFLEFYKDDPRGRSIMADWIKSQGRYRKLIVDALRKHHLPEDLLYVAMIESSYDPHTYSYAGASGLWQFMPEGGRIYGLRQDYWVDERNDPEKSNEAVMLYWEDLYDRFGTWHITLAAFNAGYGAVMKSMAKFNTNDYWRLIELESGLPWESSVYVPKALACAIVGHNLDIFGYDKVIPDAPFEFDRITVPSAVSLEVIARAAGVTTKAVAELNPQLRRGRTPPGERDYPVRIPKGTKDRFSHTFPQLRGDWDGVDAYVLRHGERLEDVATIHGISEQKLRELNSIKDLTDIHGGVTIVVPRVAAETKQKNRAAAELSLYHSEIVPGDPDEPMMVPVPDKAYVIEGRKQVFYRVVVGDSLEGIAVAFGVKVADLARWNSLDFETKLTARMILQAWVEPSFDADKRQIALLDSSRLMLVTTGSEEHLDLIEGRKGRKRVKITAKRGDTLKSIGERYGLSQYDVARINKRGYAAPLVASEPLTVYEIVDYAKAHKAGVTVNGKVVPASKPSKKSPPKKKKK